EDADRRVLPLAQLFDERDALLKLPLSCLELLHLGQHRPQLTCLELGAGDLLIDLERFLAKRPEPPEHANDGRNHDHRCGNRDPLRRRNGDAGDLLLLLGALALDGEQVDTNHRSPARRSARPTATAAVEAISAESTLNFFASNVMRLKGSK